MSTPRLPTMPGSLLPSALATDNQRALLWNVDLTGRSHFCTLFPGYLLEHPFSIAGLNPHASAAPHQLVMRKISQRQPHRLIRRLHRRRIRSHIKRNRSLVTQLLRTLLKTPLFTSSPLRSSNRFLPQRPIPSLVGPRYLLMSNSRSLYPHPCPFEVGILHHCPCIPHLCAINEA